MEPYTHRIQYYETDRMGITHHSNYIRWMEEARLDLLDRMGWGYDKLEAAGVISPVLAVDCRYRHSTTYGDTVSVQTWIREFKGVKLTVAYEMRNAANGELVLEGTTEHCFLDRSMRPLRLKKVLPEFYRKLCDAAQENAAQENAARKNVTRENAAREKAAQENAAQENAARGNAAQENAARGNAARENAARENAARKNVTQENAARKMTE